MYADAFLYHTPLGTDWKHSSSFYPALYRWYHQHFFVSRYLTARALNPARESAKKQVEFIAAASHELRSPLAVIRSGVSALQKSDGEDGGDFSNGAILKGGDNSDRILSSIDKECSRSCRAAAFYYHPQSSSDLLFILPSTPTGTYTLPP